MKKNNLRKFCVAPMMGYTTPHARKLYRILSHKTFLFTEMIHSSTLLYSKTKDLKAECKKADIIVAAVGVANLVKEDWVKEDSIIIDVGINKIKDKIVGDVDYEALKNKVRAITPVPGGVGPMTIACLLQNTVECFKKLNS